MKEQLDSAAYYHIAYTRHSIMNPLDDARFLRMASECELGPHARVLDIGSGNGWSALLLARDWNCFCTQVDISEQWTEQARVLFEAHGLSHRTEIHCMEAADFNCEEAPYDLVLCLGTAPVYGGFADALGVFSRCVRPDGYVIIGEPSARLPLPKRYAEYLAMLQWDVHGERQLMRIIDDSGFEMLWNLRSTRDEWDRYMGMQWKAISDHARAHPGDEQANEFLDWVRDEQEVYLRYQRHWVEWNVMLLRAI
ncbi:MAG: class I SAM-dependent methyltransferase [Bacteroidetes bacterium]|nr:class I SAM-dependent methyltransferase [Bacteroidota bacterium]